MFLPTLLHKLITCHLCATEEADATLHFLDYGIRAQTLPPQQQHPLTIHGSCVSSSGCRSSHGVTVSHRLKVGPMLHCRFEMILELNIAVCLDMASRAVALGFEQASKYYRVEVYLLLDEYLCSKCLLSTVPLIETR